MKRLALLVVAVVLILMTSCMEPWEYVEPCNIRIQNRTGKDVLFELVKNPGSPQQSYTRIPKNHSESTIYTDEGETYTLYCMVSEGMSTRYESGYSYQIELLSSVGSVDITTSDVRNYVTVTYEGGVVHFEQHKENPNT